MYFTKITENAVTHVKERTTTTEQKRRYRYWDSLDNRLQFVSQLERSLHITQPSDWESVTIKDVLDHGGRGWLSKYNGSLSRALKDAYPDYIWPMARKTHGYWTSPVNQLSFVKSLERKLNIVRVEDWHSVTVQTVQNHGGKGWLNKYGGSLVRALRSIYPHYNWVTKKPRGYWSNDSNQRQFIKTLEQKLNIQHLDEWNHVTKKFIQHNGGAGLLKQHNDSVYEILTSLYPMHNWKPWGAADQSKNSKNQQILYQMVKQLFPSHEIMSPYIYHRNHNLRVEYDIFVPSLALALEYNGEHHYSTSIFTFNTNGKQQARDERKQQFSKELGITLVVIPYWWRSSSHFVQYAIAQCRPDLVQMSTTLPQYVPAQPSSGDAYSPSQVSLFHNIEHDLP